jgi:uncharacterized membrane protein
MRTPRLPSTVGRNCVLVTSCVFFAVYVAIDLNRLCALRVGSNTGEYLQTAVNFIRFGSTYNYVDWNSTLAMHDQWMTLAIVPFALIWPHPESVIVLQVLALAATAPLLFVLVRKWGGTAETAAIVSVAYLLQPSVQGFANAEFVPLDFVPLLSVGLAIALTARSLVWSLVLVQLLCGTKEDVGLFLCWFGLVYAAFGQSRFGLSVAALSAINLVTYYVLAHGFIGGTVHPTYSAVDVAWPQQLAFLAEISAPFAFSALALGWRVLLAFPLLAELFFAHWDFPLYQAGSYYTVMIVTAVVLASAYVLARHSGWARFSVVTSLIMVLFFNTTVLHFGRHWYSCDALYTRALAWSFTQQGMYFSCEDQGAWTVASADTEARLVGCVHHRPLAHARAAWGNEALFSDSPWTQSPGTLLGPPHRWELGRACKQLARTASRCRCKLPEL